mmetsp:Transcript_58635/g.124328  ORF Transcript_58635/g.124328 Transcript_58635/m.124328 type:complete len:82 (+) Transcript_58635:374-619(+)
MVPASPSLVRNQGEVSTLAGAFATLGMQRGHLLELTADCALEQPLGEFFSQSMSPTFLGENGSILPQALQGCFATSRHRAF